MPIIQRKALTNPPSYGLIIGNLLSVKEEIENYLLSKKNGLKIKENLPFVCVVNPPRYGKSLLLDSLFLNKMTSVETCLQFFWIRVLMSVTNSNLSLLNMYKMYGSKCNSFDDVINISENFILDTVDVIICVDEFSSVTDYARKVWSIDQQKQFTNDLNGWKSLNPLRQFIMSGFNKDMTNLLRSGSTVQSFSLQHCTFRVAKPLLSKIYEEYVKQEKAEQFPVLIFECIKSSPGLIGQWAEFVRARIFIADLQGFVKKVNWLILLTNPKLDRETGDAPLDKNWILIMKFLIYEEFSLTIPEDFESELISSNLAVNYQLLELNYPPFHYSPSLHHTTLTATINRHVQNIFKVIAGYNIQQKEGTYFEAYVEGALRVRLLLRQLQQTTVFIDDCRFQAISADESSIPISAVDFLPTKRVYDCNLNGVKFSLFIISDKEDLKKFLINPLFYMFPVGVAAVTEEDLSESGTQEKRKSISCFRFGASLVDTLRNEGNLSVHSHIVNLILRFPFITDRKRDEKNLKFIIGENLPENNQLASEFYTIFLECCLKCKGSIEDFKTWEKDCGIIDYVKSIPISKNNQKNQIINPLLSNLELMIEYVAKRKTNAFIPINKNENDEGLDGLIVVESDSNEMTFIALELKDRRSVPEEELQMKLNALSSSRCLIKYLQAYLTACDFQSNYLIVLARRDHGIDEDN